MLTDLLIQDYLGMVIRVEGDRIYMSMAKYIENAFRIIRLVMGSDQSTHRHGQP